MSFCENLAELGCPQKEKNPDMWFRYLTPKEQSKVAGKLLDIMERNDVPKKELPKIDKKFLDKLHKETAKRIKMIEDAHRSADKSKLVFKGKK